MNFLGMDVEQCREHAERTREGGARLEDLLTRLSAVLSRGQQQWIGPDAEDFRGRWHTEVGAALQSTADLLAQQAGELDGHVAQQEAASSPDGAEGGAGDAGDPDAHGDVPFTSRDADPGDPPSERDFGAERGTVDPDVANTWEHMSDPERRRVAQQIVDEEFARYGMEPVDINFTDLSGNGQWNEIFNRLSIDEERLADPDILHTLVHEVRHAAQHQAISDTRRTLFDRDTSDDYEAAEDRYGATEEEIRAWRDNQRWPWSYTSPPDAPDQGAPQEDWDRYYEDYAEYVDQPVEVDARRRGREFVDGMTPEDLEGFMERAGV